MMTEVVNESGEENEKYIEGSQKPVEVTAFTGKGELRHGNETCSYQVFARVIDGTINALMDAIDQKMM